MKQQQDAMKRDQSKNKKGFSATNNKVVEILNQQKLWNINFQKVTEKVKEEEERENEVNLEDQIYNK